MVKPVFCFFHIGHGTDQPQMLVDSIRKFNPNAEIIYCTDIQSPKIDGVTHRLEFTGNPNEIMTLDLKVLLIQRSKSLLFIWMPTCCV